MNPSSLYQWVMVGPSEEEAVGALNDDCLCRLSGWLARDYDINDATGRIYGLCLMEQADRFAAQVKTREENL